MPGVNGVPRRIRDVLNSATPGKYGSDYRIILRRLTEDGFEDANATGETDTRVVVTHPDTPGVVYKLVTDHIGAWQNRREYNIGHRGVLHPGTNSETAVPEAVREHIAGATAKQEHGDVEDGPLWIAMENADTTDVGERHARVLFASLRDAGWASQDLHDGNIGLLDDEPVLIDYVYLKPIELMPEVADRVEDGVITTVWGSRRETLRVEE